MGCRTQPEAALFVPDACVHPRSLHGFVRLGLTGVGLNRTRFSIRRIGSHVACEVASLWRSLRSAPASAKPSASSLLSKSLVTIHPRSSTLRLMEGCWMKWLEHDRGWHFLPSSSWTRTRPESGRESLLAGSFCSEGKHWGPRVSTVAPGWKPWKVDPDHLLLLRNGSVLNCSLMPIHLKHYRNLDFLNTVHTLYWLFVFF